MDRIGMSPIEWASAVVANALLAVSLCGLAYTIFTPSAFDGGVLRDIRQGGE